MLSWPSIGLLLIVSNWIGLLFLIWKWKGNASMTFSQHAAQYKASRIYYAALFTIILGPYLAFMIGWFSDSLNLPILFDVTATMAVFGMLVAAIVPETKGWMVTVHRVAAFSMATLFIPMTVLILSSDSISVYSRTIALVALFIMIVGFILLILNNKSRPRMLRIQASYIAAFHITVLAATFLG